MSFCKSCNRVRAYRLLYICKNKYYIVSRSVDLIFRSLKVYGNIYYIYLSIYLTTSSALNNMTRVNAHKLLRATEFLAFFLFITWNVWKAVRDNKLGNFSFLFINIPTNQIIKNYGLLFIVKIGWWEYDNYHGEERFPKTRCKRYNIFKKFQQDLEI